MKTIVKGKNVEVPDRVRAYAERKLQRIERMLDDRSEAVVELSNEMHRSAADAHIAEVTLSNELSFGLQHFFRSGNFTQIFGPNVSPVAGTALPPSA